MKQSQINIELIQGILDIAVAEGVITQKERDLLISARSKREAPELAKGLRERREGRENKDTQDEDTNDPTDE